MVKGLHKQDLTGTDVIKTPVAIFQVTDPQDSHMRQVRLTDNDWPKVTPKING